MVESPAIVSMSVAPMNGNDFQERSQACISAVRRWVKDVGETFNMNRLRVRYAAPIESLVFYYILERKS